ncbi:MAG: Flagellar hook-length control protein-like protein [Massilibacillus sp.]|nr:Flagellar hook-length control protein-like protein [Massilibacillus sp.]
MDMQVNLVVAQPDTNTANAKTSATSNNLKTTTKSSNNSDKKSGKNFTDALADANTKTELATESATDNSSANLMNNMAGLSNVAVLVAISSMQVTPVNVETTAKVDDTVAALIASQGEEKNFTGMIQNEIQDIKANQVVTQVGSGVIAETLKDGNVTAGANANANANNTLASDLSQTQLTADAAKVNDTLQLKAVNNDLAQMQVLKNSEKQGEQVVNTVTETPVLQELQVANSELEKPLPKTNVANKGTEKSKDNVVNINVTNVNTTTNTTLTNANAADTHATNDTNNKVNVDSTLANTFVAEKTAKSQMATAEVVSNNAEPPNTNQFGQFVTLAANQLDKNMSTEAATANATTQPLVEYDIPGQIVEQAHLIKGTEDTQMVIKLKPEHLGELTLKVTVENGTVSASFHSDNSQVRGLLETTMAQLKQDLTSQGIKVDTVGVYGGLGKFLSDGQSQPGQQGQNSRFKNRKINVDDFEDEVDKVGGLMSASGVTDEGVDYRV